MHKKLSSLSAVDFFCGAGGMSYGLHAAGIEVVAGIDNDEECRRTYETNIPGARYIKHDIATLSAPELGRRLGIQPGDESLVFAGCSPCQFWSKIRTDRTKSAKTAHLLKQFEKFVRYFKPGFVIVENVPGLYRRKAESILPQFHDFLDSLGYSWDDGVVNAINYGVPQKRMRYLLVATRRGTAASLPPTVVPKNLVVSGFIGVNNGFPQIFAGNRDQTQMLHTAASLSPNNLKRIQLTAKSGGSRDAWSDDETLQIPAYRGRDQIFRDVYGRMSWDKPAPTITTRFNSLSNGRFGHPEEDRAISLREGATLQTFPKTYKFHATSSNSIARQIGNAVPPELARRIGIHLISMVSHGED